MTALTLTLQAPTAPLPCLRGRRSTSVRATPSSTS